MGTQGPKSGTIRYLAELTATPALQTARDFELIRRQGPWRTIDAVETATAEWVDWYNHRRINEYAGDMPPVVLEEIHYAQQQPSAAS